MFVKNRNPNVCNSISFYFHDPWSNWWNRQVWNKANISARCLLTFTQVIDTASYCLLFSAYSRQRIFFHEYPISIMYVIFCIPHNIYKCVHCIQCNPSYPMQIYNTILLFFIHEQKKKNKKSKRIIYILMWSMILHSQFHCCSTISIHICRLSVVLNSRR